MSDKWVTWRIDQPGMVNGVHNQKRGDHQLLPATQAKSMVAQGLADYGRVSVDKLGLSYKTDPDLLHEVLQEVAARAPKTQLDGPEVAPIGKMKVVYQ